MPRSTPFVHTQLWHGAVVLIGVGTNSPRLQLSAYGAFFLAVSDTNDSAGLEWFMALTMVVGGTLQVPPNASNFAKLP